MRKYTIKQRDFLNFSISLFLIVTAWIAFSLYHSYVTTTISEDLQVQIVPIDPTFDTATIEKLQSRERIEPLFQRDSQQDASTPATLSPTPLPDDLTPTPIDELPEEETLPTEEPVPTDVPLETEESTPI